jgi:hypothetical protein
MKYYLKFNINADQICITPQSTYFKAKALESDLQTEEVFVSEEHFPLLAKIVEQDGELSKLLAFENYGSYFVQSIKDTQDYCDFVDDVAMSVLNEKHTSHVAWPTKNDDLLNEWHESPELQSKFPDINEFIRERRREEIWNVSEIWEISHGKKIDLTQTSLTNYSAGGWSLDGGYIEEPSTFVAFANISKIEIELIYGDVVKRLTDAELKYMLINQYADKTDQLVDLQLPKLVDRGMVVENNKKQRFKKRKIRLIKITIFVSILIIYCNWVDGYL